MKTIVFFNRKGGTGKTSLSFMFSRYLSAAGHKTVFIDADPQRTATGNFTRLYDIPRETIQDKNLFFVLLDKQTAQDALIQIDDNTRLIAGSYDIAEIQSSTSPHGITDITANLDADYCVIDNAPNFSALISAALSGADTVVIPTLPAYEDLEQSAWSLKRARKVNRTATIKILLNQCTVDGIGGLSKELLEFFQPEIGAELITGFSIPQSKYVRAYTATGERITSAKAKNKLLKSFTSLYSLITDDNRQLELF